MFKSLTISALVSVAVAKKEAMIGSNIGGWMVLEPWITPSLFYRFLGNTKSDGVGFDSYTFCEALGPVEGNAVMRSHWDHFITEDVVKDLADREVEIVRVPIGDWTTTAYGPYVGCMDGAAEKIRWLMDTCHEYGIKVLLDVHALKGSQNGFDNSGQQQNLEWIDETHFKHWSVQAGNWMGHYNPDLRGYDEIYEDNIQWGVDNITNLMKMYGDHPALYAVQPVNEPWEYSDMATLKDYYRRTREEVRKANPDVKFVFHDAFWSDAASWNDLFPDHDMENVVLDSHKYLAWNQRQQVIEGYCDEFKGRIRVLKDIKYPVWIGEWALATDVCAFWLGGFNESRDNYQMPCEWVDCPVSYMPAPHGVDFDRTVETLGPWGENDRAMVNYGKCAKDSAFFSDDEVKVLGQCIADVYDEVVEAQFIWTARNELEEKWSYVQAYDKGWLKTKKGPKAFLQ